MSDTSSEDPEPVLQLQSEVRSKRKRHSQRELKKASHSDSKRVHKGSKTSKKKKKAQQLSSKDVSPKESSSEHSTSSSEETNEVSSAEVNLDDFIKREEEDFVDDASCLVGELQKAYSKFSNDLRKPNVLLTGITGSGKSSIINAVFGKNVAKTAAGYPVTQHFMKYQSDDMRVVIYDSKGLEHGEFEDFISSTQDFFNQHKVGDKEGSDAIHVIWYIINCAHSRWEPFEERICRELFDKVPIIFILNKADISAEEDRQRIRGIIEEMTLPNCVGIFDTVAIRSNTCQTIEECPQCGSDDLVIRKKTATAQCMSCSQTTCIKQKDGLAEVITTTCRFLPEVVREAFISAQTVSVQLKETTSHRVIEDFWDEYENVRTPGGLLKMIANMMARLSIIWEFKQHGQVYGELWARDLVSHLKWKDKINLLFHKKMEQQRIHLTALGILWNRCIRNLAIGLLQEFTSTINTITDDKERRKSQTMKKSAVIDTTICSQFYRKFFTGFNEENLSNLEEEIRHIGLKTLLASDSIGDIYSGCLGNSANIFTSNSSQPLRGSMTSISAPSSRKSKHRKLTSNDSATPSPSISINHTITLPNTFAHTTSQTSELSSSMPFLRSSKEKEITKEQSKEQSNHKEQQRDHKELKVQTRTEQLNQQSTLKTAYSLPVPSSGRKSYKPLNKSHSTNLSASSASIPRQSHSPRKVEIEHHD